MIVGSPSPDAAGPIRRGFVRVGGRAVHYRVAGTGPTVILLHDSPRSSRLHVETMRRLSGRFRVIALDTPGYGNSDPLDGPEPGIPDFAEALGEAIDALGLAGAPLYATHTSAKIALHYAAGGGRPSRLVLDGIAIPTAAPDEAFIARYMRPFTIDATGAYLAAEWTRLRDMLRWFPWFDARAETRMPIDTPSDDWIAAYALDLFSAGGAYSSAYAAAMRYDPRPALRDVSVPTLIGARRDDVLFAALDRVPSDNPALTVERLEADRDAWLAWIERGLSSGETVSIDTGGAAPEPVGPCYVDGPHGQIFVRQSGGGGRPLLILGAPTTLHARAWAAALAPHRATLVPDLPGYGESNPLPDADPAACVDALAAAVAALGHDRIDLLGLGLATPLAALLARRHPMLVDRLVLDGAMQPPAAIAARDGPSFTPKLSGSHLLDIWHMLRDAEVQHPWHDGRACAHRRTEPVLDGIALHDALLDILKQPEGYAAVALAALDAAPYRGTGARALLFDVAGDPAYRDVAAIASAMDGARLVERPADIASAATLLRALLDGPPAAPAAVAPAVALA